MSHRVLLGYHHELDEWRAARIRDAGGVDFDSPVSDQGWERITMGGVMTIERWINARLLGKSCLVVLIGPATAGCMWIDLAVRKAWRLGKGVVGVYIHNLGDRDGNQATKGVNPFDQISLGDEMLQLSGFVKAYDPPANTSDEVSIYIADHLEEWVEEAIAIRRAAPNERQLQLTIRSV